MARASRLSSLLVPLAAVCVLLGSSSAWADQPVEQQLAAQVLDSLDAGSSTEADTVLLAARAEALLGRRTEAELLFNHLDELAVTSNVDHASWGLSYRWDAFGDGTTNPASTAYSYTTAAAGLAYLDAWRSFGDTRFHDMGERAAASILDDMCCWRRGSSWSVWYSDAPADQRARLQVHNVNGLTLALLSRLSAAGSDAHYAEADRAARSLIASQGVGADHPANWKYGSDSRRSSDLIHLTFIIEGLYEYGGTGRRAARRAGNYVAARRFHGGQPVDGSLTWGSLRWGPAAGVFVLLRTCHPSATSLLPWLRAQVQPDGTIEGVTNERARAWYALALAQAGTTSSCRRRAAP